MALAGPAHALSDHQRQFVADVVQHGGVNADGMINGETQKTLGDAVCGDLHKDNAAANEVIGVAMFAEFWCSMGLNSSMGRRAQPRGHRLRR